MWQSGNQRNKNIATDAAIWTWLISDDPSFLLPRHPHPSPFLSITWELNDGDLVEAQWVPVENWLVDKNPPIKGGYFLIYI